MTAGLETFAKVRALQDRAATPGEKAAAMTRMQTLARKAGMSVEEAVSRLDAPKPKTQAQAAADAFNDFFNTPEFRAAREERERERAAKRAKLLPEYGSEDAVFADTPMEAALRAACEPLLGLGETWNTIYRLDGWGGIVDSRRNMPVSVRRAVSEGWPLPATVAEAWAEFQATDKLSWDRSTFCYDYTPHSFVEARRYIVEDLLNSLPARGLNDLRARLSWMEWWNDHETNPDVEEERVRLATLRADVERMGARIREQEGEAASVQSGHGKGYAHSAYPCSEQGCPHCGHPKGSAHCAHPSRSPDPAISTAPVQSGHQRRTSADKRRDVIALLNAEISGIGRLSDREIARRAGVSPATVGTIRRTLP